MPTFAQRWSPSLNLLVNPKDPTEPAADFSNTGGDPRHNLATVMPPRDSITDNDWADLVTGKPHPSQVAGEDTAPSGAKKISDDDWGDLVTGKPAPSRPSEPPEPPPEPDLSGGFGIVGKGFKKAPVATAAIGAPLAIGAIAPFLGMGMGGVAAAASSLPPFWQALIGGSTALYGVPWAARKIGEMAGAPQVGEAVGTLADIVHGAGKAFTP